MANTSATFPTAATTSNANSGVSDWTNPTNIEADDTSYALAYAAEGYPGKLTYRLLATDFDFAIPSGATIDGVIVKINRAQTSVTGFINDAEVKLIVGGSLAGNDKASGDTWPFSSSFADQTYGANNDVWGATLSSTVVNASDFGVSLAATLNAAKPGVECQGEVDYVTIQIYYTEASGISGQVIRIIE